MPKYVSPFQWSNQKHRIVRVKVLQIYKFCQCKNGTHKIYSNEASSSAAIMTSSDSYSFKVDCNRKRFFSSASQNKEDSSDDSATGIYPISTTKTSSTPPDLVGNKKDTVSNDMSEAGSTMNNIWSIFGMSSFANSLEQLTHVKLFALLGFNYVLLNNLIY